MKLSDQDFFFIAVTVLFLLFLNINVAFADNKVNIRDNSTRYLSKHDARFSPLKTTYTETFSTAEKPSFVKNATTSGPNYKQIGMGRYSSPKYSGTLIEAVKVPKVSLTKSFVGTVFGRAIGPMSLVNNVASILDVINNSFPSPKDNNLVLQKVDWFNQNAERPERDHCYDLQIKTCGQQAQTACQLKYDEALDVTRVVFKCGSTTHEVDVPAEVADRIQTQIMTKSEIEEALNKADTTRYNNLFADVLTMDDPALSPVWEFNPEELTYEVTGYIYSQNSETVETGTVTHPDSTKEPYRADQSDNYRFTSGFGNERQANEVGMYTSLFFNDIKIDSKSTSFNPSTTSRPSITNIFPDHNLSPNTTPNPDPDPKPDPDPDPDPKPDPDPDPKPDPDPILTPPDFNDPPFPEVPEFYEQKYSGGFIKVFDDNYKKENPFSDFLNSLKPNIGSGKCPVFMWSMIEGENEANILPPCYIFDWLRAFFILLTSIACYRIIFNKG